jgi:ParB-like chromosome segregation protein Spo0J
VNDERAAAGFDHLQRAALEMIAAARAFLDVAEELVVDREAVSEVVHLVGSAAQGAMRAAARSDDAATEADDRSGSGVQPIKVS